MKERIMVVTPQNHLIGCVCGVSSPTRCDRPRRYRSMIQPLLDAGRPARRVGVITIPHAQPDQVAGAALAPERVTGYACSGFTWLARANADGEAAV
jgi:hypothetical protein